MANEPATDVETPEVVETPTPAPVPVATAPQQEAPIIRFSDRQLDLIRRTIAPGVSNDELELFAKVCEHRGLDPFLGQIHATKRRVWNPETKSYDDRMSIQTGIDGLRLIAERTGRHRGFLGPYWCGPDGKWLTTTLPSGETVPAPWTNRDQPPTAALVGVLKEGFTQPTWAVAAYDSYVQTRYDQDTSTHVPNRMWATMPDGQIAKCAEALALRRAFPAEMSGLYTDDEMGQADNDHRATTGGGDGTSQPDADTKFFNQLGWESRAQHDAVRDEIVERGRRLDGEGREAFKKWADGADIDWRKPFTPSQIESMSAKMTELEEAANSRAAQAQAGANPCPFCTEDPCICAEIGGPGREAVAG